VTGAPDPTARRWVVLAVIVLAQTVANIGPLGIPAIASLIRDDLDLTRTQAGSFLSAYYVGPVAMSFFAGMLADRWGTAKTLVLGQALIAAGLLAAAAAGSYDGFIALNGRGEPAMQRWPGESEGGVAPFA
jgi:MFS family permease